MQLEVGADNDDRTARVVDTLTKKVLTEATLLAFEHVGQRLEGTISRTGHRTTTTTVVEQSVNGLLKHSLLVVDDDLGSTEVEQSLETVVPVDHPAVEIVQVGGGESATVELDHRAKIGWDDRDGLEDHVLGAVLAFPERLDDLHALGGTLASLLRSPVEVGIETLHLRVEVEIEKQRLHGLGAHTALVIVGVAEIDLTPELLGLDELLRTELAESVERFLDQLDFSVGPLLAFLYLLVDFLATSVDLLSLGAAFFHTLELVFEGLETHLVPLLEFCLDDLDLLTHGLFELGEILLASLVINRGDDVAGEVNHLLHLLGRHVEQIAETTGNTLEEPDVGNRCRQLDMTHTLTANLGPGYLDAAAFADDPLVADPLVLTAVTLPVPLGTENALVEQALLLRAKGSVVDRFRLLDLSIGPGANLIAGGKADL